MHQITIVLSSHVATAVVQAVRSPGAGIGVGNGTVAGLGGCVTTSTKIIQMDITSAATYSLMH